jgi:hypothetical protein
LKAELRCRYDLLIVIGRETALQDTLACSAGESFGRIQKGIGDTRMTQARSKKSIHSAVPRTVARHAWRPGALAPPRFCKDHFTVSLHHVAQ